jgi:tetratricopeptide (TPR) repeat protein
MIELDDAAALRRQLQPVIDHVAQQTGARTLRKALALVEGFAFFAVVSNSSRAAAALQLWLEDVHAGDREDAWQFERVSPYPLDPLAPGQPAGDRDALAALIFAEFEPGEAGRARFIDATRASAQDLESWQWVLMRLNERRNVIARALAGPLVLILPGLLEGELPRLAPDLWSIRSAMVEIRDLDVPRSEALLRAFDSSYQTEVDEARIESDLARAREQAAAGLTIGRQAALPLLLQLARARFLRGAPESAELLIDEATAIAQQLADPLAIVSCQLARSDLLVERGELAEALALIDEVIPVLAEHGDAWALANAQDRLATILAMRGELDEALRIRQQEELPVYERVGDVRSRAVTLGKVADILFARGQFDEALRIRQQEQLPVYERVGDVRSRAVTLGKVADILQARGQLDEALHIRQQEQLPTFERLGDVRERAVTLGRVADILQARGQLDEALRILQQEELPVYERLGDVRSQLLARTKIALLLAQRGRLEDRPQIDSLLATALADARRLRIPEAAQIEAIIRRMGGDPNRAPFV